MKAIIFKGKNGQFYFRIIARNNKTIAQSEGYKSVRNAAKTAKLITNKIIVR